MRSRYQSDNPWEERVGYARAVRSGPFVAVSGTTATAPDGSVVAVGDPGGQTREALEQIGRALEALGAGLSDVMRVRTYVIDIAQWPEVAAVLREHFDAERPASTMVEVSGLADPDHLVEVEVEAWVVE